MRLIAFLVLVCVLEPLAAVLNLCGHEGSREAQSVRKFLDEVNSWREG